MTDYKVFSQGQDWTFSDGTHASVSVHPDNQRHIPNMVRNRDIQEHGPGGDMELGDILFEERGVLIWEATDAGGGYDDGSPLTFIALAGEVADDVTCRLLNALVAI